MNPRSDDQRRDRRQWLKPAAVMSLAASLGLVAVSLEATGTPGGGEPEVRVIIQLADEPAFAVADDGPASDDRLLAQVDDRRAELRSSQRRVVEAAERAGVEFDRHQEFTDLINAVAVTVTESDVDVLAGLPGVERVVPEQRVRALTDVSVPLVGAPEVWERADGDGAPVRGEGTTVAVIDTGVDYTNPSLGGGFGPEHKVVGGYDFVNGDDDPMDDNGHGTHVAGTIAGDGKVTGVAPDARILAYKVLDDYGSGWQSDIIAALEAAVDPGNAYRADVINLSLGGPGDGTDPLGLAATAAADAGAVVIAAAGNSGPGEHTLLSPALAEGVIAIGASASGLSLPTARMVAPREEPLQFFRAPYSASPPEETITGELVDVGDGWEEDYDRVGDVTGKVVAYRAVLPGSLTFVQPHMIEQARLAEERGAIALLAYSEYTGPFALPDVDGAGLGAAEPLDDGTVDVPLPALESGETYRMDRIVVLSLLDLQWSQLVRDMAEGPVEIAISGEDVTDRVASFSSRGPAPDFSLKPNIVAPGVEIASTWPLRQYQPGVYRISGTSMAAPHVAGAAALLRQLEPGAPAERIGARLVGSAKGLDDAAVTAAGAGRLDVAAAADLRLSAWPTAFDLGLADMSAKTVVRTDTVTLYNDGENDLEVRLRAQEAQGSVGTATVAPVEAVVPAGGELEVELTVSADRPELDADISGWVVAESDDGDQSLRVPYQLSIRHLVVRTSPDPSDGTSAVFVWAPAPLAQPPMVTVTPQRGRGFEVTARHDHGSWYRADLSGLRAGAYRISVRAHAAGGQVLIGESSLDVVDGRGGTANPGTWQPIGPNGASGPIAMTPADPDVAVVSQFTKAGPWRTEDGGRTWTQQNRLPVAGGTGNVVVDARDPDAMWYAVNGSTGGYFNYVLDPTYQGRILRTGDGGDTWKVLDFPDVRVVALLSDTRTQALVAVTADALLVSRDRGDTWSAYPNKVGDELVGAAIGGDDLYLATTADVWALRGIVSAEPTEAERVYVAEEGYFEQVRGLAADDDMVVALIGGERVIGSSDAGASWEELYGFSGGGMYIVMRDGDIAVTTYLPEIHMGHDHGASWSVMPQPIGGAIEDDFAHWADGGLLWSAPDAGLFRTGDDGGDPRRIGVQGQTAYDLAVAADESGSAVLLAGTDLDVFDTELPTRPKLASDVAEWGLSGYEAYVGTRVGQLAAVHGDPRSVWKIRKDALSQFWVYRSTDGGAEWELRGRTDEVPFDIAVSPVEPDRVVVPFWSVAGVGLYVTTDAGEVWRKYYHGEVFTAVAADPAEPERLWLGSATGLYRSDDFGQTVEKVIDGQVTAVGIDGSRIVAAGQVIQVSDDGGETFRPADSGNLPMLVSDIVVSPDDPDTWYAAAGAYTANGLVKGGRGVLRSTDGGLTWANISRGLQNTDVVSLAMSPDGRWLFAGTLQGGVHRVRAR